MSPPAAPVLSPQELGLLREYLLALTTDDYLLRCAAQVRPPRAGCCGCLLVVRRPHHQGQNPPAPTGALSQPHRPLAVSKKEVSPFVSVIHAQLCFVFLKPK